MRPHILLAALALPACREELVPPPVAMTEDALGYYCQMNLNEHAGPKGQIHLEGSPEPIFFAQVRDTIAYLREPERNARIRAVYVSNMSRAPSWDSPGENNWIAAADAFLVVGGDMRGGMGAREIVPFETETDAKAWQAEHGGEVMRLDDVPSEAVLGDDAANPES